MIEGCRLPLPFRRLALLLLFLAPLPAWADNPFGLMLWPSAGEGVDLLLARARGLGVAWYRPPAVFTDRWSLPCRVCGLYQRSGLLVALTLRNGGSDSGSGRPSVPPRDLAAYRRSVESVLEAWKPALLVVEHEEGTPHFYADPDPGFRGYAAELREACAAAHQRGLYCTNGGLDERSALLLAWNEVTRRGPEAAADFGRRAFPDSPAFRTARSSGDLPPEPRQALAQAQTLLALYAAAPLDALNLHWYGQDARLLAEVGDILQRAIGKPLVSTELGQRRDQENPQKIRPLLRAAFAIPLKVAIWFSIDTPGTLSLFEPDGRLRPAGVEFRQQMSGQR